MDNKRKSIFHIIPSLCRQGVRQRILTHEPKHRQYLIAGFLSRSTCEHHISHVFPTALPDGPQTPPEPEKETSHRSPSVDQLIIGTPHFSATRNRPSPHPIYANPDPRPHITARTHHSHDDQHMLPHIRAELHLPPNLHPPSFPLAATQCRAPTARPVDEDFKRGAPIGARDACCPYACRAVDFRSWRDADV